MELKKLVKIWQTTGFANYLKKRRFNFIVRKLGKEDFNRDTAKIKLLDIGCANGKDFLKFLFNNDRFELYGLDIRDYKLAHTNFKFILSDADKIDYPDKYFDIVISMGVLEHIQPIEKLCEVIKEIDRVSKSYFIAVPCISSIFEPHIVGFFWQLKDRNRKKKYAALNYYSDDAWLQFTGFKDARTKRAYYIPFFQTNLWIYKNSV